MRRFLMLTFTWCAASILACKETPKPALPRAVYVEGATVTEVELAPSTMRPLHETKLNEDVVDAVWSSDGRIVALTQSGGVHVIDKGVARAVQMPPANAWGSGPTNVRLVAHLEEQKSVKARLAAGEQLEGDYDQEYGSDPYPSMAKLVRVESGDVELVSCQFYDKPASDGACQDWVWSTLNLATLAFGPVSAPGPAYVDPDTHAAPSEQRRVRPPSRAAPLAAPQRQAQAQAAL